MLPNGKVLVTSSGVIDTTYNGYGGNITYYVPKDSDNYNISSSGISGNITFEGAGKNDGTSIFITYGCGYVTSLNIPNIRKLLCYGMSNLTQLIAPEATDIDSTTCALTAKSIGDILYAAYIDNRSLVVYDFSGGANAEYSDINRYIESTYDGLTIGLILTKLTQDLGGLITINGL